MFLNREQIQELTGYKIPSKQKKWLCEEGFIFKVAGDGKPRVLRSEVYDKMSSTGVIRKEKQTEPNFEAI